MRTFDKFVVYNTRARMWSLLALSLNTQASGRPKRRGKSPYRSHVTAGLAESGAAVPLSVRDSRRWMISSTYPFSKATAILTALKSLISSGPEAVPAVDTESPTQPVAPLGECMGRTIGIGLILSVASVAYSSSRQSQHTPDRAQLATGQVTASISCAACLLNKRG